MTSEARYALSQADTQRMVAVALETRMFDRAFRAVSDPVTVSPLSALDRTYPYEYASAWTRQAVGAALDHLDLWANIVQPLKQWEGMEVNNKPRGYYTLARAAAESAAQARWVLAADSEVEMLTNHLQLVYDDQREFAARALLVGRKQHQSAQARMALTIDRVPENVAVAKVKAKPTYLEMLRASAPIAGFDVKMIESVWRGASAAAHGKNWFQLYSNDWAVGEEYEPGYYRTQMTPRVDVLMDTLELAKSLTAQAVVEWLQLAGHDTVPLLRDALNEVKRITPRRDAAT